MATRTTGTSKTTTTTTTKTKTKTKKKKKKKKKKKPAARAQQATTKQQKPQEQQKQQEQLPTLRFAPVTKKTWPDLVRLFEGKGGPSYCWCMAPRATPDEAKLPGPQRKPLLQARVDDGVFVGLVGYDDGGVPVAWVSVGPRDSFRAGHVPVRDGDDGERVWVVTCFFVVRALRKRGVMQQLLAAAQAAAKKKKATLLEATPVDPGSPSYRFGGFLSSFVDDGFVRIGKVGSRRHVVRKAL